MDARSVFYPKDENGQPLAPVLHISSASLVDTLVTYVDSPWAEWRDGKPITQAQLARLLKPFGIAPKVIRLTKDSTMRGYERTQFEDALERYL